MLSYIVVLTFIIYVFRLELLTISFLISSNKRKIHVMHSYTLTTIGILNNLKMFTRNYFACVFVNFIIANNVPKNQCIRLWLQLLLIKFQNIHPL